MEYSRAEEPYNILAATAPAPDFFPIGFGSWFFSQAAPAPATGIFFQAAPALDYWLSLAKFFFFYFVANSKSNTI